MSSISPLAIHDADNLSRQPYQRLEAFAVCLDRVRRFQYGSAECRNIRNDPARIVLIRVVL